MAFTLTSRYSDIRLSKLGRTHLVDMATISRTSLKSSKSSMHLWFARNVTTSTTGRAESGIVRRRGLSPAGEYSTVYVIAAPENKERPIIYHSRERRETMCMVTFHGAVKMTAAGTDFLGGRQARLHSHDRDAVDSTAKGLAQYVSNKQLSTVSQKMLS